MRIVAFITQTSVIDQILTHLRARAARESHAGPRTSIDAGPREPGRVTHPAPVRCRPDRPKSTPSDAPRPLAGTFGVRDRPTGASDGSPPASASPR